MRRGCDPPTFLTAEAISIDPPKPETDRESSDRQLSFRNAVGASQAFSRTVLRTSNHHIIPMHQGRPARIAQNLGDFFAAVAGDGPGLFGGIAGQSSGQGFA